MNEEIIKKAREAKTVEELIALAKEYNEELTEEQAKALFDRFHSGALSDDELVAVAGGAIGEQPVIEPVTCTVIGWDRTSSNPEDFEGP